MSHSQTKVRDAAGVVVLHKNVLALQVSVCYPWLYLST
jgi:hypothetical protein